jgi:hypothetical protein
MSTRTVPIDHTLTPSQAMLADQIGNEVYSSHYAERKAYRLILGCGTVLLCGSMWLNFSLAHRPIANRYIRIDEMGRAQAIQYSDLNYSPREGEVRTYLTDWANYRYTIPVAAASRTAYGLGQPEPSRLAGHGWTGGIERRAGARCHHHFHVRRDGTGGYGCTRDGTRYLRQVVLSRALARASDGALAPLCDVLPEPEAGQRSVTDLPAV